MSIRTREGESFELIAGGVTKHSTDEENVFNVKPQTANTTKYLIGLLITLLMGIILFQAFRKGEDDRSYMPLEDAQNVCSKYEWEVYPERTKYRKIYDLFMVRAELDLLEIRLEELWDQVDYFVMLESAVTHTDRPKPLYVTENWNRFQRYHKKMILHVLDYNNTNFSNTWARENFQRNAMYDQIFPYLTGHQKPNINDVILISDLDEIPKAEVLEILRNCVFPPILRLASKMYYYSFQFLQNVNDEYWPHPQATFYAGDKTIPPQVIRDNGTDHKLPEIPNAGWHCSYCLDKLEEIVIKLGSSPHTEFDKPSYTDRALIFHRAHNGLDLFNRSDVFFDRIIDNQDIPEYVKFNRKKFIYMLDRDPADGNFVDYRDSDSIYEKNKR